MRPSYFLYILLLSLKSVFVVSQTDKYYNDLIKGLKEAKNDTMKAYVLGTYCSFHDGNNDTNLKYSKELLRIGIKTGHPVITMNGYATLGDSYWYMSDFDRASENYFKLLDLAESTGNKHELGRAYYSIGWMKSLQGGVYKDRTYLLNALKLFSELKDTANMYQVYNGLGGIYGAQAVKDSVAADSALYFYEKVISMSERMSADYDIIIHGNYANLLFNLARYEEAKKMYRKCADVCLANGDTLYYLTHLKDLASVYYYQDSNAIAKKILLKILPATLRAHKQEVLQGIYSILSGIYSEEKKYEEALMYYRKCIEMKDSVELRHLTLNVRENEAKYLLAKKEGSIKMLEHEREVSDLKNEQNNYVILTLGLIALIIIIVSINLFRANRSKLQANKLLNEKNVLIEEQKRDVDERNHDITNSINYAKRIQEAVLPAKEIKYKLFPDAFVLFLPKDIVSGDFYWFGEKNGKRLISAIDCTGHGVPGAFMSLIGNTFLHEAVNEKGITEPAKILDDMKRSIIAALKQSAVIESAKDGMDMALLSFDDEKGTVEFAGAYNPCWLIRNGEFTEFKADKKPIGYYMGNDSPFTNTEIKIQKGDCFYIFSDGYADQFGGDRGKKLKEKQLKEILLSCYKLPMIEQEKILFEKFQNWKGKLEQIDDVCVIGVRV